jgi:hypothetical protein
MHESCPFGPIERPDPSIPTPYSVSSKTGVFQECWCAQDTRFHSPSGACHVYVGSHFSPPACPVRSPSTQRPKNRRVSYIFPLANDFAIVWGTHPCHPLPQNVAALDRTTSMSNTDCLECMYPLVN